MSSEDLIRQFWVKDGEVHFTPSETRLYFALMQLMVEGELIISDAEIAANVGVCMATMKKNRQRLADAGLIVVSAGNGRGCKTVYTLPSVGEGVPQPVEADAEVSVLDPLTETVEVVEAVPQPTEEVKPKRERVTRPKDGDLFGKKDMRPKRKMQQSEVEPPDMDDVLAHFISQGVSTDIARTFYYHYDSLGWMTNSGVRVKRWESLANKWITKEKKEQNYGCSSNQTGDAFKRSIAERFAKAECEYRKVAGD